MSSFFKITLCILLFVSCSKDQSYPCQMGDPNIIGAECNDGWDSQATGQGACSSHNGVDYWICCCKED